jgi:hypothetical protein
VCRVIADSMIVLCNNCEMLESTHSSGGFEVKGREGEPPGPSRFISHDTTFTDTTSSVIDFGRDSAEECAASSALSSDKHESGN